MIRTRLRLQRPALVSLSLAALLALGSRTAGADDWPQIMGPQRNGKSIETAPPPAGAKLEPLWSRKVGAGFAGPVVKDSTLILFHRQASNEIVEALDVKNGATRWRSSYSTSYKDDFGFDEGPRSPATISGDRVFTFGAEGKLTAFSLADGQLLWQVNTKERFAVPKGFFGAAGSPLVLGDRLLVNLGGAKGTGIVAFAVSDGSVLWQATDDPASYSSGVSLSLRGRSAAAFLTRNGLTAVDVTDGRVLATHPWRSRLRSSVNAAIPTVIGQQIFLTASYGTGDVLLDLSDETPRPVWSEKESLASHYATPVLIGNHLFGFHGRVEYGGELRAIALDTGEVAWSRATGAGSLIAVGNTLLVLLDSGELLWVNASPDAFQERARVELFDSTTRALPAYSNGVFYARDQKRLAAYRLGATSSAIARPADPEE